MGTISQAFATQIGQTYTVDFDMGAENSPATESTLRYMTVSAAADTQTYSYDSTGWTASAPYMRWDAHRFAFTATANSTTLSLSNTLHALYGPAVDNVRVNAVPEPTAVLALSAGMGGLVARRRSRRA